MSRGNPGHASCVAPKAAPLNPRHTQCSCAKFTWRAGLVERGAPLLELRLPLGHRRVHEGHQLVHQPAAVGGRRGAEGHFVQRVRELVADQLLLVVARLDARHRVRELVVAGGHVVRVALDAQVVVGAARAVPPVLGDGLAAAVAREAAREHDERPAFLVPGRLSGLALAAAHFAFRHAVCARCGPPTWRGIMAPRVLFGRGCGGSSFCFFGVRN